MRAITHRSGDCADGAVYRTLRSGDCADGAVYLTRTAARSAAAAVAVVLLTATPAVGQTPWTLEQCIEHAVSHNISLKQQEANVEKQGLQLSTARNSRLPDLNASVGENVSFGRGLTADNTYSNTNTTSTNFSVSTSVPLFTGNRIPHQIKLSQLNLEASTYDLEKARNDISTQVAAQYVQVLYDMEMLDVARRQVSIDSAQVARLQSMVGVGRSSRAELSQQEATLAQSRLTVTQGESNLRLSLLTLAQLLELDSTEGFSIERYADRLKEAADADRYIVPRADDVYAEACAMRPELRAEQLRLSAAEHSISIARSALLPQLSFSAGLGTNYYTTSGFANDGFGRQLKNNFSQYLGLNLSIPIFNRFQTRNSIRSARLDHTQQQLQVEQTRKQLYKEIQQACTNTVSAAQKTRSCVVARQAADDAFQLVRARYEQGIATPTEFNEAKNTLMKTESDLSQARYEFLYQKALILFYRGLPLHL